MKNYKIIPAIKALKENNSSLNQETIFNLLMNGQTSFEMELDIILDAFRNWILEQANEEILEHITRYLKFIENSSWETSNGSLLLDGNLDDNWYGLDLDATLLQVISEYLSVLNLLISNGKLKEVIYDTSDDFFNPSVDTHEKRMLLLQTNVNNFLNSNI